MTLVFRPTGASYLVPTSQSLNGVDFNAGDYPNAVLVTNTDTGNAVVASVYSDTGNDTYAKWPSPGEDNIGHGFVIPPSTAVLIAVNSAFAAAGPGSRMAATTVCDTGKTATVLFNSGTLE